MIREHVALYVLPISYIALAVLDKVWLKQPVEKMQILSAALVIIPGLVFDLV